MTTGTRMIGNYEVIQSVSLGTTELVVAENVNESPRYVCCDIESNDIVEYYQGQMGSDDYLDIMHNFSDRLAQRVSDLEKEAPKEMVVITKEMCKPLQNNEYLTGKIIVLNAGILKREFQTQENQLFYVTGGNGTNPKARGTGVFGYNLATKQHSRVERYDIIGTIKKDKLPEWAKTNLVKIKTMIRQREEAR